VDFAQLLFLIWLLALVGRDLRYVLQNWQRRIQSRRTRNWSRAQAKVVVVDLCEYAKSPAQTWQAVVRYSYWGEGTFYTGVTKLEPWATDIRSALASTDDLAGAAMPVRYNPNNPYKSVFVAADGGPAQFAAPMSPDPSTGLVLLSLK
jgi:hypothetical protein